MCNGIIIRKCGGSADCLTGHMPHSALMVYIFAEPTLLSLLYFFVLCIILQRHGATPVHQNLGFSFFLHLEKWNIPIKFFLPTLYTPFEHYNQITNNSIPLPSKLNKNDCADKLTIENDDLTMFYNGTLTNDTYSHFIVKLISVPVKKKKSRSSFMLCGRCSSSWLSFTGWIRIVLFRSIYN